MAVLTIGGVVVPTPTALTPSMYDITEGERDSTGTMHIDLICTKYKLECSWAALTQENMSKILNAIKPITFDVTFVDPESGSNKTINVYKGDRSMPFLKIENGNITYKDFKVNFVEL